VAGLLKSALKVLRQGTRTRQMHHTLRAPTIACCAAWRLIRVGSTCRAIGSEFARAQTRACGSTSRPRPASARSRGAEKYARSKLAPGFGEQAEPVRQGLGPQPLACLNTGTGGAPTRPSHWRACPWPVLLLQRDRVSPDATHRHAAPSRADHAPSGEAPSVDLVDAVPSVRASRHGARPTSSRIHRSRCSRPLAADPAARCARGEARPARRPRHPCAWDRGRPRSRSIRRPAPASSRPARAAPEKSPGSLSWQS